MCAKFQVNPLDGLATIACPVRQIFLVLILGRVVTLKWNSLGHFLMVFKFILPYPNISKVIKTYTKYFYPVRQIFRWQKLEFSQIRHLTFKNYYGKMKGGRDIGSFLQGTKLFKLILKINLTDVPHFEVPNKIIRR